MAYLPYLPDHPLCPITAIVRAFLSTPVPSNYAGPAFLTPSPSGFTPLLYSKFLNLLKAKLKLLDLDSSRFATHSFRRGGTTWAFAQGIPGEIIMAMGDWHSAAYLSYVTISPSLKQATMMQFVTSLPSTLGLEYRNFPCIMRKILLIYCPEIWGAHYAWVQKIWKKISVEISVE